MKYYSEILNKNFDSEKELVKAEEEYAAAEAKKAEAKALVQKESADVQEAFKARNAARHAYNEKLVELRKTYNEALRKARDEFESGLEETAKVRDKAEAEYDSKLKEFQKAHPEGYRITLKDGDNVVTLSSNTCDVTRSISKEFDDMLDMFSDFLRRW